MRKHVAVELYIPDDHALFEQLHADRESIEADLGITPEWRELPDKKASRIITFHPGDFRDIDVRSDLQRWMVDTADTYARVFRKRL